MSQWDVESRIKEKLEKTMLQLQQKLAEIPSVVELRAEMAQIETEIATLEATLADEAAIAEPHEQLHARLEQLMTKRDYIGLRLELHTERQERLRETLEELRQNYERQKTLTDISVPYSGGSANVFAGGLASSVQEERRKILEMLQNGQITVEDANRLLAVLGEQESKRVQRRPRWVRIRVTATDTGQTRLNVTLPIGLVKAGLRAGGSIAGIEGVDTKDLEALLSRGEVGHLLDMVNEHAAEHVEISVE